MNQTVEIISFPVAPLGCNCSILRCTVTNETIVIDPGGEAEKIIKLLEAKKCSVRHIIHTHAHFDHILGTDQIADFCHESIQTLSDCSNRATTNIGLHKADEFLFTKLEAQCRMFGVPVASMRNQINHWLEDNENLIFGETSLNILHTPGHTPGSLSFYLPEQELLFSGDTLFARSIGRTDLPGGDHDQILKSIRTRLFTLDDNTTVIPGHGTTTRIFEEKQDNPFF